MKFEGYWASFYDECLKTLKGRIGFDETYLVLLDRYVFVNQKLAEMTEELAKASATVQHTNKASHTNESSNPALRVFVILNKESLSLAKELGLTPTSAKNLKGSKRKKAFDLTMN